MDSATNVSTRRFRPIANANRYAPVFQKLPDCIRHPTLRPRLDVPLAPAPAVLDLKCPCQLSVSGLDRSRRPPQTADGGQKTTRIKLRWEKCAHLWAFVRREDDEPARLGAG